VRGLGWWSGVGWLIIQCGGGCRVVFGCSLLLAGIVTSRIGGIRVGCKVVIIIRRLLKCWLRRIW
jgi:hypothetical protein